MKHRWVWAIFGLALAACNPLIRDPRVDAEVRSAFDQLRRNDDAALTARFDPALRTPEAAAQLAALKQYVPAGAPRGREAVATNTVTSSSSGETVSTTDEYDYGDRRALVDVRLHRANRQQPWQIQGLHVQLATNAQLAANHLTLAGKPAKQDLFLLFVIASPLLMIAALVKVVRTRGLKRKWLWGILAFIGLTGLRMNWTTGEIIWQPLTVQLINAGIARGLSAFSPWILSATLPVGAVLILTGVWANPRRAKTPAKPVETAAAS